MMTSAAVSLEVSEASVYYGANIVLDRISLHAAGGEFIALLGASGCGKTTLLRAICGFVPLAGGRVAVGGHDCRPTSATPRWCSSLMRCGRT
jgi:ABC-type Fe3+/spermidine/putrescine transport system ATPase subunit